MEPTRPASIPSSPEITWSLFPSMVFLSPMKPSPWSQVKRIEFTCNHLTPLLQGPAVPEMSVVFGAGLDCGFYDSTKTFSIQTYDQFGNSRNFGGDNITVEAAFITGTGTLFAAFETLTVSDEGDGSYTVTYKPLFSEP